MPVKINSDGTWSQEYTGPYAGLNVQAPETNIPDNATPSMSNFMLRNAELRSRPALQAWTANFPAVWPLGISTFIDANGKYHTVGWQNTNMYQYNPSGPSWVSLGACTSGNFQNVAVAYRTFANKIYYSANGAIGGFPATITPTVGFWDGITANPTYTQTYSDASTSNSIAGISKTDSPTVGGSLPGAPTVVGPLAFAGLYIGELNNQLILANITLVDQNSSTAYSYPNLMWWSASGLPLQWDPTQNTSAGFNPFLDVSDQITGLMTLGVAGYLFRTYGITQFAPTGSAVAPWEFDHMWASDHGIGSVLPWSIAQYGPTGAFVAQDNIYSLSITNAAPIGGTARDAIMRDIATAAFSGPGTAPFANIIPIIQAGYVYLTYQLLIPIASGSVRNYVYSFEDRNWSQWDFAIPLGGSFFELTCAPNVV